MFFNYRSGGGGGRRRKHGVNSTIGSTTEGMIASNNKRNGYNTIPEHSELPIDMVVAGDCGNTSDSAATLRSSNVGGGGGIREPATDRRRIIKSAINGHHHHGTTTHTHAHPLHGNNPQSQSPTTGVGSSTTGASSSSGNNKEEVWNNSGLEDVAPPANAYRKRNCLVFGLSLFSLVVMSTGIHVFLIERMDRKYRRGEYGTSTTSTIYDTTTTGGVVGGTISGSSTSTLDSTTTSNEETTNAGSSSSATGGASSTASSSSSIGVGGFGAATPGGGLLVTDTFKRQEETEQCLKRRQVREQQENQQSENDGTMYDSTGRFILQNYDAKPTFSDFLPGVAGLYGKPLWSFYVNRGQAIASFGTLSKNYPILEFNPANKAYQNTPYLGFRTFIHGTRHFSTTTTEEQSPPFSSSSSTEGGESSSTTTTDASSSGEHSSFTSSGTTTEEGRSSSASTTTTPTASSNEVTFLYEPFSPSQTNHYAVAIEELRRELLEEKKDAYMKTSFAATTPHSNSTETEDQLRQDVETKEEQMLLEEALEEDPILLNFIAEHCLEEEQLPQRTMYVGGNEIQIQEIDTVHGLEVNVSYFVLPEENYGAFVRRTTILNTDPNSSITLSVLDGLAKMEPMATRPDRDGADVGGIREEDSGAHGGGGGSSSSMFSYLNDEDGRHGAHMDEMLKHMSRTLEGYFKVEHADDENRTMPFYKSDIVPSDDAAVEILESGHYCIGVWEKSDRQQSLEQDKYSDSLLPIIYDTEQIFGQDTSLQRPAGLLVNSKNARTLSKRNPIQALLDIHNKQYGAAKTSSGMAGLEETTLEPGESVTINTLYGMSQTITDVPLMARKAIQRGYIFYKLSRAREIVQQLTSTVTTKTSHSLFDGHVQQMFMDNGLRGGIPMILGDIDDRTSMRSSDEDSRLKVYYVFSRQHGDLERDYNNFVLDPTYFSQGPGNYRDVLQNRRTSVQFHPRVGSHDVHTFLSFVQADGYNPLKVEASVFVIKDEQQCDRLATMAVGSAVGHRAQRDALEHILCNGPFRPGQLFLLMEEQHIELIMDRQRFVDEVVSVSHSYPMAVFGDGYWADHWTYYMDLIEAYLSIYPDREYELLFDSKLNYFYSATTVKPRSEKYVLSYTVDGWGRHVRQLNATISPDIDKFQYQYQNYRQASTGWFSLEANWQHDVHGFLFTSTPMSKLFLLASLKFATRDAYGMGIEYEAGKPGWNDAMNGFVGMVGSGMPETYELKRLLKYLFQAISIHKQPIVVPHELKTYLLNPMEGAITTLRHSNSTDLQYLLDSHNEFLLDVPDPFFEYWNTVSNARERYRDEIRLTFSGVTTELSVDYLLKTIGIWIEEIDGGIDRALRVGCHGSDQYQKDMLGKSTITPTYFAYDVTRWTLTGQTTRNGLPLVNATSMRVKRFNLFLEGPTRQISTFTNPQDAQRLYQYIKSSGLRDKALQMYTISDSLQGQSIDIGRSMAFAKGWLENQSVWLHMSYKYYLALLKQNLYTEFYEEMVNGGMLPFMDPQKYARSLLECSSFLVSSAFEDPQKHGRGYMARFSGATSEFLSMYMLMFVGPQPFFVDSDSGQLAMQLVPALPYWFFQGAEEQPNKTTSDTTATKATSTTTVRQKEEEEPTSRKRKKRFFVRHLEQQDELMEDDIATFNSDVVHHHQSSKNQQHQQREMMGILGSILSAFGGTSGGNGGSDSGSDSSNNNNMNHDTTTSTDHEDDHSKLLSNQDETPVNGGSTTTNSNENNNDPPTIMFTLFGTIRVTYHNLLRQNLFDIHPTKYIVNFKDGSQHTVYDSVIRGDLALKIRGQLMVDSIHAYFGTEEENDENK